MTELEFHLHLGLSQQAKNKETNKHNEKTKRMKIIKSFTLAALIGLLKTSLVCQAQMTYDAAREFSLTDNPTVVWSYGYSGSFGTFTTFPGQSDQSSALPFWRPDPNSTVPTVGKNTSGQILEASGNIFQIDQMVFHPGDSVHNQYAMVRFTAPKTGAYTLTARFSGVYALDAGTTSDVHVLVNGMSFFDGAVQGYGSEVSFTPPSSVTLRDGDTVDFVVGNGGNGYWGDFTGLAATVNFIRPVAVVLYPAVEIGWNTEVGKSYQVQFSTTLRPNEWTDLGAPVPGDGEIKYLFDSTRGQSKKYYRVLTVE